MAGEHDLGPPHLSAPRSVKERKPPHVLQVQTLRTAASAAMHYGRKGLAALFGRRRGGGAAAAGGGAEEEAVNPLDVAAADREAGEGSTAAARRLHGGAGNPFKIMATWKGGQTPEQVGSGHGGEVWRPAG